MADFTHVDPDHPPHSLSEVFRWAVTDRLTGRRHVPAPGPPAPRVALDSASLSLGRAAIAWLGHASFLLRLGGLHVLIDPVLGGRLGIVYRRYQAAGLAPSQLPTIDVLLLTHGHRDHMDAWTLKRLDRNVQVVVPQGLGSWFERRRFSRVRELGWWEGYEIDSLRLTLVPARHWSRRGLGDLNASLWGGFVMEHRPQEGDPLAIYHAGDSAYWHRFQEIGERFPSLDAALMPIGAYAPGWFMEHSHMTPEQAGRAFLDLGARRLVPMHWGTFRLTDEPLREPTERLRAWWREKRPSGELCELPVGGLLHL